MQPASKAATKSHMSYIKMLEKKNAKLSRRLYLMERFIRKHRLYFNGKDDSLRGSNSPKHKISKLCKLQKSISQKYNISNKPSMVHCEEGEKLAAMPKIDLAMDASQDQPNSQNQIENCSKAESNCCTEITETTSDSSSTVMAIHETSTLCDFQEQSESEVTKEEEDEDEQDIRLEPMELSPPHVKEFPHMEVDGVDTAHSPSMHAKVMEDEEESENEPPPMPPRKMKTRNLELIQRLRPVLNERKPGGDTERCENCWVFLKNIMNIDCALHDMNESTDGSQIDHSVTEAGVLSAGIEEGCFDNYDGDMGIVENDPKTNQDTPRDENSLENTEKEALIACPRNDQGDIAIQYKDIAIQEDTDMHLDMQQGDIHLDIQQGDIHIHILPEDIRIQHGDIDMQHKDIAIQENTDIQQGDIHIQPEDICIQQEDSDIQPGDIRDIDMQHGDIDIQQTDSVNMQKKEKLKQRGKNEASSLSNGDSKSLNMDSTFEGDEIGESNVQDFAKLQNSDGKTNPPEERSSRGSMEEEFKIQSGDIVEKLLGDPKSRIDALRVKDLEEKLESSPIAVVERNEIPETSPTTVGEGNEIPETSPTAVGERNKISETSPTTVGERNEISETSPATVGERNEISETSPTTVGERSEISENSPTAVGERNEISENSPIVVERSEIPYVHMQDCTVQLIKCDIPSTNLGDASSGRIDQQKSPVSSMSENSSQELVNRRSLTKRNFNSRQHCSRPRSSSKLKKNIKVISLDRPDHDSASSEKQKISCTSATRTRSVNATKKRVSRKLSFRYTSISLSHKEKNSQSIDLIDLSDSPTFNRKEKANLQNYQVSQKATELEDSADGKKTNEVLCPSSINDKYEQLMRSTSATDKNAEQTSNVELIDKLETSPVAEKQKTSSKFDTSPLSSTKNLGKSSKLSFQSEFVRHVNYDLSQKKTEEISIVSNEDLESSDEMSFLSVNETRKEVVFDLGEADEVQLLPTTVDNFMDDVYLPDVQVEEASPGPSLSATSHDQGNFNATKLQTKSFLPSTAKVARKRKLAVINLQKPNKKFRRSKVPSYHLRKGKMSNIGDQSDDCSNFSNLLAKQKQGGHAHTTSNCSTDTTSTDNSPNGNPVKRARSSNLRKTKPKDKYIRGVGKKCLYCDQYFKFQRRLEVHERAHENNTILKCYECDKIFHRKNAFTQHMNKHITKTLFTCKKCNEKLENKQDFLRHLRSHLICGECGKPLANEKSLQRHEKKHLTGSNALMSLPQAVDEATAMVV